MAQVVTRDLRDRRLIVHDEDGFHKWGLTPFSTEIVD
jgi:hypothetical protein